MSEPPPKKSKAEKADEEPSTLENEDQNSQRTDIQPPLAAFQGDTVEPIEYDFNVPSSPREPPSDNHCEGDVLALDSNDNRAIEVGASCSSVDMEEIFRLLRDILPTMNQHPIDWAKADGFTHIAPTPSDVDSQPVKRPSDEIQKREKRGDGKYKCPVCWTKDCEMQKCRLPFSGPGLFRAKTNGKLYYFRKLVTVRLEREETPQEKDGEIVADGYSCTECKQPIKSSKYHKEKCPRRPGTLHRLAADGETRMVGFPIRSKASGTSDSQIPKELESVLGDVLKALRALQLVEGSAEDHEMTSEAVRSQNDDDEDDGHKKPVVDKEDDFYNDTEKMDEKVQKLEKQVQVLKTKATRISNVITDSPYFAQLCDWVYSVCDPNGTNHVGKADLYAGILMVHIKLAKLTGVSATFPPTQETVYQLFDACDTNGSGGINREEFDIFLSASSAQIFGRILVNLLTYIFVIPYYSKHIVDSFGLREGSYWEVVAEQACGLFLFFVIVPIFWNMIDDKSHQTASQKAEKHREIKKAANKMD